MKITETSLKRIIREELERLAEAPNKTDKTDWAKVLPTGIVKYDEGKKKRTDVEVIQKALKALSVKGLASDPGTPDGKYGMNTLRSIRQVQKKATPPLKQDGDYGPDTRKAMLKVLSTEEETPTKSIDQSKVNKEDKEDEELDLDVKAAEFSSNDGVAAQELLKILDVNFYGQVANLVQIATSGKFGRAAQRNAKIALQAYPSGGLGRLFTGRPTRIKSAGDLISISKKTLTPTKSAYMNEFINAVHLSIVSGIPVNVDLAVKAFFAVSEAEAAEARQHRERTLVKLKKHASDGGKFGPNSRSYKKRLKRVIEKVRTQYPMNPVLPENEPPSEKQISAFRVEASKRLKQMATGIETLQGDRYTGPNFVKARKLLDKAFILPADTSNATKVEIPAMGYKAAMMADRKARGLKT